jgi:hypothetical protein
LRLARWSLLVCSPLATLPFGSCGGSGTTYNS